MRETPKIGLTHTLYFQVQREHLITFADDQMPAVLSTPSLLLHMERTAREALQPFLTAEERSVGVEVDLKHLAGTGLGASVKCVARLLGYQEGQATFQIEASDAFDLLARGVHRRRVVNVHRLRKRIEDKLDRLAALPNSPPPAQPD